MNEHNNKISTIFKYIGGKTWLRSHLRDCLSISLNHQQFDYYVEPFSGGLGAFINVYDLLLSHKVKKIILNDINQQIIYFYKIVQHSPQSLIEQYMTIEKKFSDYLPTKEQISGLHKVKDKEAIKLLLKDNNEYYQSIRTAYNNLKNTKDLFCQGNIPVDQISIDQIAVCAMFLFLQNHAFNGVYRENAKGHYNTPFNWDAKTFSHLYITEKIMAVHQVFSLFDIEFSHVSYKDIDYSLNALYYLDPPYINEAGLVENKYNVDAFTINDQEQLIKSISKCFFIYSNHQSDILIQFFKKYLEHNYQLQYFNRKNIMSSSVATRTNDKMEILVSYLS